MRLEGMAASKAGNASIWPKVRKALLLNAAAAAAGRGGLLKKFAGLGFGKRATPAQKTQVVQKLRRKHSLDILLSIAQLSRADLSLQRNGGMTFLCRLHGDIAHLADSDASGADRLHDQCDPLPS